MDAASPVDSVVPARLQLRMPDPSPHTSAERSFGEILSCPAGLAGRPSVDVTVAETASLRELLIRVLDEEGDAVGPWAGGHSAAELRAGLHDMMIVRAFDARMVKAHRQGKISFYMQCLGEEAIACAHRRALRAGDMNFPTYRQQGLLIASDYPFVDMMNQVLSNRADPLKGRQLPVLYSSKAFGYFSISGNLATQYVQAVGWAMASAISGSNAIASAWIGEGASSESDFHSALVFASTYHAPVILNIVNNQWAISTPEDFARGASVTFADRGLGFGIPSLRVDGNDYLAVLAVSKWAVERARTNRGPTLIEWVTFRAGPHSTSDDPSGYRPADSGAQFPLGDPIERLRKHLTRIGAWDDRRHEQLLGEIDADIAAAFEEAESNGSAKEGSFSDPTTMFDDVYAVMPRHLIQQRAEAGLA